MATDEKNKKRWRVLEEIIQTTADPTEKKLAERELWRLRGSCTHHSVKRVSVGCLVYVNVCADCGNTSL